MPALTLNQAAKAAKKSKATLLDAIQGGRLSAPKDEQGRYQIDPAELFRAYPANQSETGKENQSRPQQEPQETSSETSLLKANVEHLRELVRQIEGERDDLRRRLDQEAEERRATQTKLTALLTHQPANQNPQNPPPRRSALPVLLAIFAIAAAFAVIWLALKQTGATPFP